MKRNIFLKETIVKIQNLPDSKLQEVNDFTDFLLCKTEDKIFLEGIQKPASDSRVFEYLKNEEDLYSLNDLK
jgi:hypothetical protein